MLHKRVYPVKPKASHGYINTYQDPSSDVESFTGDKNKMYLYEKARNRICLDDLIELLFGWRIFTCLAFAIALITWIHNKEVFGKLSAVAVRCSVWSAKGVGRVKAILKSTWSVSGAVADDVSPSHNWGIDGSKS